MALNTTKLFTILGKHIKGVNTLNGLFTTADTAVSDLETVLEAQDLLRLYDTAPDAYASFRANIEGWISQINSAAGAVLVDRDLVIAEVGTSSTSTTDVLKALVADMNDQNESVAASTLTISGSTAETRYDHLDRLGANNEVFGFLVTTTLLDGVTAPSATAVANPEYANVISQLAMTNVTARGECVSAASDGTEAFRLVADEPATASYTRNDEKPSTSATTSVANVTNILASAGLNWDFSRFTASGIPEDWETAASGASAFEEEDDANNIFRGTRSLQVNNTTFDVKLKLPSVTLNRGYLATVMVKDPDSGAGTKPTFTMTIEKGDGTAMATRTGIQSYTNTPNLFGTPNWSPMSLAFCVTNGVTSGTDFDPDDVYLRLQLTAIDAGDDCWIDEVTVCPINYWNGIGYQFYRGQSKSEVGDSVSVTMVNDNAGVIQTYFRKAFGVQLPTSGSPTQADSLAT